MERILVLGSNSFGASNLINDLLTMGIKVLGISRSNLKDSNFLKYLTNSNQINFQYYKLNISHDIDELILRIQEFMPQIIIDFAGQGMVAESWKDPALWYKTNILSKVNLFQYLNNNSNLEKYIKISTPEVYGSSSHPIRVGAKFNPSTPYALSHSTIDQHLSFLFIQNGFPVVTGRFANFYGSGQQLHRIIPKTFMKFLKGEKLQIHGGGASRRSFIHGADISSGIISMIFNGKLGNVYHFSTPETLTIKALISKISILIGIDPIDLIEEVPDRPGKDANYQMEYTTSMSQLGWSPTISLDSGLEDVQSWVTTNFQFLSRLPLEYDHVE